MHKIVGGCHCGNVQVELEIAREPASYHPRACDCDFCRKHGAAYVSDPEGSLTIRIRDSRNTGSYRQGSSIAECFFCRSCGVLVGALYRADDRVYATINAKVIDGRTSFGAEQSVSPKLLSDSEKTKRWQEIWFSDVTIAITESDA